MKIFMIFLSLLLAGLTTTTANAYTRSGAEFADYYHSKDSYGKGYKCDNGEVLIVKYNYSTFEIVFIKDGYSLGVHPRSQLKGSSSLDKLLKIACKED